MEAVREAWTDERMDDLANRMDRGFDRVDTDLRQLRPEMSTRFDRVNTDVRELRSETNTRFNSLEGRIDAVQRMLIGIFGTMVVGFLGIIVTNH